MSYDEERTAAAASGSYEELARRVAASVNMQELSEAAQEHALGLAKEFVLDLFRPGPRGGQSKYIQSLHEQVTKKAGTYVSEVLQIDSWGDVRENSPIHKAIFAIVGEFVGGCVAQATSDPAFAQKIAAVIDKKLDKAVADALGWKFDGELTKKAQEVIRAGIFPK